MMFADPRLRLLVIAVASLAIWLLLRQIASPRWFELYGTALVALVATPPAAHALWQGLRANGRSPWLALIVALPIVTAALVQIGFWAAYFSAPLTGIRLGMGRMMFQMHVAKYLPGLTAIFLVLAAWIVLQAIGRRSDAA